MCALKQAANKKQHFFEFVKCQANGSAAEAMCLLQ